MKNKTLLITTIVLFLLINTSYLWEAKLGLLAFPVILFLGVVFIVLSIILFKHIFLLFKERFHSRQRIILVLLMISLLALIFLRPNGFINFDQLRGKDLLIARAEGAANCMTTLKFKENNKFIEKSVCFGVTEITGDYILKGDTVFFQNVKLNRYEDEYYKFAVIRLSVDQKENYFGELLRYHDYNDSIPHRFSINKYELK